MTARRRAKTWYLTTTVRIGDCAGRFVKRPLDFQVDRRRSWLRNHPATSTGVLMGGLLLVLLSGCERAPRAPALRDTKVYQNNRQGFRFLVPDNWTQTANAVLPKGPIEGEVLLVQYRMRTAEMGAALEVLCFDQARASNLQDYHAGPSHGTERWQSLEPAKGVEIGGAAGQRFVFVGRVSNQRMNKEVVAFRRGSRVFSFIGLYWQKDTKAGEQYERAVQSILWRR